MPVRLHWHYITRMLTLRRLGLMLTVALLSGCNSVVLNPSGSVAAQQSRLILQSTFLMLLIVIPVIVLIVVFAWRYRRILKRVMSDPDRRSYIDESLRIGSDEDMPDFVHAYADKLTPAQRASMSTLAAD